MKNELFFEYKEIHALTDTFNTSTSVESVPNASNAGIYMLMLSYLTSLSKPRLSIIMSSTLPYFDFDIRQSGSSHKHTLQVIYNTKAALTYGYSNYHMNITNTYPYLVNNIYSSKDNNY